MREKRAEAAPQRNVAAAPVRVPNSPDPSSSYLDHNRWLSSQPTAGRVRSIAVHAARPLRANSQLGHVHAHAECEAWEVGVVVRAELPTGQGELAKVLPSIDASLAGSEHAQRAHATQTWAYTYQRA